MLQFVAVDPVFDMEWCSISTQFNYMLPLYISWIAHTSRIVLAGEKLAKGAYVSAALMGEINNADCDAFTAKINELFAKEFEIAGQHVYTTFQTINQWGWNGKIL